MKIWKKIRSSRGGSGVEEGCMEARKHNRAEGRVDRVWEGKGWKSCVMSYVTILYT